MSKTKWVIRFKKVRNTALLQCWQKKRPTQKAYFWSQKNVFYVIFFFSCVKILFCELMLLQLGDLLGSSLLRNFFNTARSIFSCKYFSKIAQYFHSSDFIPHFVLLISRLPDIAQKTACTRNEAMDVTFQMKYVLAF